jgi:hypothetical protein
MTVSPTRPQVDQLRRSFAGEIIAPDGDGYDDARRVWNATFDRRPALIVRPGTVDDVVAAVRLVESTISRSRSALAATARSGIRRPTVGS